MTPVPALHQQLNAIADEFATAQMRLHQLMEVVPAAKWTERPAPERWSIADCVQHLNLTAEAFRGPITAALDAGLAQPRSPPQRYRRDVIGWLLWRTMGPPVRFRVKTHPSFVPATTATAAELVAEFDRRQDEQLGWVWAANGLPLGQLMIQSPFNPKIRYNLYACLSILPRHQHRHLWQAEQTWRDVVRAHRAAAGESG